MCFIIEKKNNRVKTAKEDIICYKVMETKYDDKKKVSSSLFNSNLKHSIIYYNIGRTYIAKNLNNNTTIKKLTICKSIDDNYIAHGFHSYIKSSCYTGTMTIIKCIIPKGTKYYINEYDGEYVSLKIKFVEVLN